MPIYEYVCAQCGTQREVMHKMSESPRIDCDRCEGEHLQRLVSAAGFRLKGGGWYETDFKKDGKRNLAGESSEGCGKPADGGACTAPACAAASAAPAAD